MAMRNTLLAAAGFIVLMAMTLIFFNGDNHEAGMGQAMAVDASLDGARQAYWAGDIARAEGLYRDITKMNAGNINAWGELGNIYYMQARWPEAAEAYAEVALQLIEKNDMPQAAYFHGLVNQMDRAQSERINERLRKLNNMEQVKS